MSGVAAPGGASGSESDVDPPTILRRSKSATLREQCLTAPPSNFRRVRRSVVLDYLGKKLGGNFSYEPEDMVREEEGVDGMAHSCTLTPATQQILKKCFEDLDPSEVVDYHAHIVGHGDSGSGCVIHQKMKQWWRPLQRLKASVFMFAAQAPDMNGGDLQYVSRLVRLMRHFVPCSVLPDTLTSPESHTIFSNSISAHSSSLPASLSSLASNDCYRHGKICLLAFDAFYEKDGQRNDAKTTLYVPNEYAIQLGVEFPDYFYPVGSVNPYRKDAMKELQKCADRGITIIKWLPNSMGINPSDEECDRFYEKIKELDMALLVHVGEEHSVTAGFLDNSLGNPLLLRRPLDKGVKIIAAHCATEGSALDLDATFPKQVPCYELLMRLMKQPKYKDLLFADISAICGFKRLNHLPDLLSSTEIHDRLVYGSDYPVPAINLVVHTSKLQRLGLVTPAECTALNELYNYNPLLFDLVSKRLLRSPNGHTFPASVFKQHPLLPTRREIGTPV